MTGAGPRTVAVSGVTLAGGQSLAITYGNVPAPTDAGDVTFTAGVEAAVAAGYLNGLPNGSLQPLGTATRAQAAKVLALVLCRHAASSGSGTS